MMRSKFVLAQLTSVGDATVNLAKAREYMARAYEEEHPDLMVFPELFMSYFPAKTPHNIVIGAAQSVDGPFVTALSREAKKYGMWVVCGISERVEDPNDPRKYNTTVVINAEGELAAVYRKTHLYDAFGYRESDINKPGNRFFEPINTPFGRIGLFVCYEVRFPEIARYQRSKGADVMIVPTAWSEGKLKSQQFHTLIDARAIENAVYMVACDLCGDGFLGESCIVDPMGVNIAMAGETEQLLAGVIDTDRVEAVRKKLPAYQDRRPELYTI